MLTDRSPIGAQKLACLLTYFEHSHYEYEKAEEEARLVTFQHLRCPSEGEFAQAVRRCEALVGRTAAESCADGREDAGAPSVHLHAGSMEAPPAPSTAFVNFANANFGCEPHAL